MSTHAVVLQEILATDNGKYPCIMRLLVKEVSNSTDKQAIKYIRVKEGALPEAPRGIRVGVFEPQSDQVASARSVLAPHYGRLYFDLDKELLLPFMHAKDRRADTLWLVKHVLSGSRLILMNNAETPNCMDRMARETEVYRAIQGMSIAPDFLGHIREGGRIVGFLVEYLQDCTHPDGKDYEACKLALSRLHSSGFLHGDAHAGHFLVQPDGTVLLIDFEFSRRCDDVAKFEQEQEELRQELMPEQDGTLKFEFHA